MALSFLDNINILSKKPDVVRQMHNSLSDMVNFSENYLPDLYIATCVETGKAYLFNKNETVIDPVLGKWRELSGSSSSSTPDPAPTPVKDKFYYYGTSATNTGISLSTLSKEKLELSDTRITMTSMSEYIVIAVPKATEIPEIYDINGLNYTSSFVRTVITEGTDEYYLFVSDSQVFCVDFVYKIKY